MMWVAPQKHTRAQSPRRYAHVKYSNGGCSGFEPDFLFIYSVHNFSNRIFPTLFCFQLSIPYFSSDCKRKRKNRFRISEFKAAISVRNPEPRGCVAAADVLYPWAQKPCFFIFSPAWRTCFLSAAMVYCKMKFFICGGTTSRTVIFRRLHGMGTFSKANTALTHGSTATARSTR